MNKSANIFFNLADDGNYNEINLTDLLNEFEDIKVQQPQVATMNELQCIDDDVMYSYITDYDENYTIKQLLQICEYYGFTKEIRSSKCKKLDIIVAIVMFENNFENEELVLKRRQFWYYITELKNDKFMKKFVIW